MLYDFLTSHGATDELAELIVEIGNGIADISKSIIQAGAAPESAAPASAVPQRNNLSATCSRAAQKSAELQGGAPHKPGTKNVYGEEQIAMDVQSNEILVAYVKTNPYVASYCSEELDGLQKGDGEGGIFSVFFDPLDGSSLFDVNFSVGTIVGIYEGADVIGKTPGDQVAAMYAVYGPRTTLVISVGRGVHEFLLTEDGWILFTERLEINGEKKYFAPGNLRATKEREDYFKMVSYYIKEQYTLRYSGGMVPDINHILKKGSGIFLYPGMPSAPDGKLRLMYECGPMAYLVEQAGGASSNGKLSILDLEIKSYEQKTPIYVGVKEEVKRAEEML